MKIITNKCAKSVVWLVVMLAIIPGPLIAGDECLLLGGSGSELLFTLEDAYNDGINNAVDLESGQCGDLCIIQIRDNSLRTIAFYDSSDLYTGPFFTIQDALNDGIVGTESLSFDPCGDICLFRALNSGNRGLAVYDAGYLSGPLLTVQDAINDGLVGTNALEVSECGNGCLIGAQDSFDVIGFYDPSDVSSPLFTVQQAINDGVTGATELFSVGCGDRCLIQVTDGSNTLAYYDASDVYSGPLFTLDDAYNDGFTSVISLDSSTCGNRCLITARIGIIQTIVAYDASDTSSPLFSVDDAIYSGIVDADRLGFSSCGDLCFFEALNSSFRSLAIFAATDLSSPIFTREDAYNDGLVDVDSVTIGSCGNFCLIEVQNSSSRRIAYYDVNDLNNGPLFTVADAIADGIANAERLNAVECGERCLIEVLDSSGYTQALYDVADVSSGPIFTIADAIADGVTDAFAIAEILPGEDCVNSCLIKIWNSDECSIAIYDASNLSEGPLLTIENVYNDGITDAMCLDIDECAELCIIEVYNSSNDLVAYYNASNVSEPLLTVQDAIADGFIGAQELDIGQCDDDCLIGVEAGNDTIAFYRVGGTGAELTVSGLSDLAVCRDEEFCYQFTVANSDVIPTGAFTIDGLLDGSWAVQSVLDCSKNPSQSYAGPDGSGIWTNVQNGAVTFDQDGTGTWSIPSLDPGESLCIELCVIASEVKNVQLNITATPA